MILKSSVAMTPIATSQWQVQGGELRQGGELVGGGAVVVGGVLFL